MFASGSVWQLQLRWQSGVDRFGREIDIRAAIVIKIRTQYLSDKCNHHGTRKSMISFQHFTPIFYFSLILGQLVAVQLARGMNKIGVCAPQSGTVSF